LNYWNSGSEKSPLFGELGESADLGGCGR
jgi:hypothetical protein